MRTYEIKTRLSTHDLESADTETTPLVFTDPIESEDVSIGDGVVLTSGDGDHFIGRIVDVVDTQVYVELR